MGGDDEQRFRQELRRSFTENQVAVLRSLRGELSSRRRPVRLEIDAAQVALGSARGRAADREQAHLLEAIRQSLDRAHEQLAPIPKAVIPAF
jgi:hypothetical protein